jgi:hypothetical protein
MAEESGDRTKVTLERASPADLHGVGEKVASLFQQVPPRDGKTLQVCLPVGPVEFLKGTGFQILQEPSPGLFRLSQHYRIGMLPGFFGHPGGMETAYGHGYGFLPETIADGIPPLRQRGHDADGHQVGAVVKVDFLDVFVLDGDIDFSRGQRCKGSEAQVGEPEKEVTPEASLRPSRTNYFYSHFLWGHRSTQMNTDFIFAKDLKIKDIMGHG